MQAIKGPRTSTLHWSSGALPEVLVDPDLRPALEDSICVRVARPCEGTAVSERLVPPRQRGVHDVLAISDDGDEPSVWRMHDRRREDLGGADLLNGEWYPVAVSDGDVLDRLEVARQNGIVAGVDELAGGVHAERGFISAKLGWMSFSGRTRET